MDKYRLSNETQAAKEDSSALYHMGLFGSVVAIGAWGNPNVSFLICDWLSDTMCSLRENNLKNQEDSIEKFHFQSPGSICATL